MKLTDENKKNMLQILDDLTAMIRLHPNDESVHLVFNSHTLRVNKSAADVLVYLARKGLENDVPTVD